MPTADRSDSSPAGRILPCLFFTLSGVSGLVFETVWIRQLKLILGNTVYAVSLVFSVYMAGLAIGSMIGGRVADSRRNLFQVYALLECAIGLSGFLLTLLLDQAGPVYVWFYRLSASHPVLLSVIRYFYTILLLFIPTILMGATLPVLVRCMTGRSRFSGRTAGLLYALNTFGAAGGCFAAGFYSIRRIGMLRTSAWASILCVSVGLGVFGLKRYLREAELPVKTGDPGTGRRTDTDRRFLYILVCAAGFCSLGFEVLWTRLLIMFLGNTVYAFSAMLTVYLFCIAAGSLVSTLLLRKGTAPGRILAGGVFIAVCYSIGSLSLLHLASGFFAPYVLYFPLWEGIGQMLIRAAVLIGVPAVMFGMMFPAAVRMAVRSGTRIGQDTGTVYCINTAGAIAGSALTGFVLIPLLGTEHVFLALNTALLAAGIVFYTKTSDAGKGIKYTISISALFLMSVIPVMYPAGIFRRMHKTVFPKKEIIFYREDPGGTVLVRDSGDERELLIDNICVAGTSFQYLSSHKSLAHLPMLFHPDPEEIFVLGFGAGGTSYSISRHPEVRCIDAAELIPSVGEAAPLFSEMNGNIIEQPEYHLSYTDGRHFLLTSQKKYDVISIDLFCPQAAGAGNLYTREFYALCEARLQDDGVLAQWIHPGFITLRHLKMILRGVQESFPWTSLWFTYREGHMVLLCGKGDFSINADRLAARMAVRGVKEDLAEIRMDEPAAFLRYFIAGGEILREFAQAPGPEFITDDLPLIEFELPFINFSSYRDNLDAALAIRSNPVDICRNADVKMSERLGLFFRSTGLLLKAIQADFYEDRELALKFSKEAVELNPDDADADYWYGEYREKYATDPSGSGF